VCVWGGGPKPHTWCPQVVSFDACGGMRAHILWDTFGVVVGEKQGRGLEGLQLSWVGEGPRGGGQGSAAVSCE